MSQDTVGIIKAAAETASWARAHGCVIEIHIGKGFGHGEVKVTATPVDVALQVDDSPTTVLQRQLLGHPPEDDAPTQQH